MGDLERVQLQQRPWVLKAHNLQKRYGHGCSYCAALTGPDKGNRCPVCGTVIAKCRYQFYAYTGRSAGHCW